MKTWRLKKSVWPLPKLFSDISKNYVSRTIFGKDFVPNPNKKCQVFSPIERIRYKFPTKTSFGWDFQVSTQHSLPNIFQKYRRELPEYIQIDWEILFFHLLEHFKIRSFPPNSSSFCLLPSCKCSSSSFSGTGSGPPSDVVWTSFWSTWPSSNLQKPSEHMPLWSSTLRSQTFWNVFSICSSKSGQFILPALSHRFFRLIPAPGDVSITYILNGLCKYISPRACKVGTSLFLHCIPHSVWCLLLSFGYRYYILGHAALSRSTIVKILLIIYIPSLFQGVNPGKLFAVYLFPR